MNLNTVTEVKRPASTEEIPEWREGYAWLAGGTWLFSTPQIATHTLIDLEALRWPALQATAERPRYRRDLHHRRARAVPGAGRMDRRAAVATVLPCASDVVQDLECGDGRREYLHVVAGRRHDLAHDVAGRHLHAVAARREAAQGRGAGFRHWQPHECAQAGGAVAQHPSPGQRAHQALRLPPLLAHPSRAVGRHRDRHARAQAPGTSR